MMVEYQGLLEETVHQVPLSERRASSRSRWPRATACCAVADRTNASWLAHIRDLSTLGVGLVLPVRVEAGTLLEIELKNLSNGFERAVQARVIHVRQAPEGEWLLGCAFTAELNEAHLQRFQANRLRASGGDHRRWIRYPCNVETVCQLSRTCSGERVPARVVDVCPGGVGLVLPCEFDEGTMLLVELPTLANEPAVKVLVRIVRVVAQGNNDWFFGCEFADQLTEDDLAQLR
jgi:hypothetical protein